MIICRFNLCGLLQTLKKAGNSPFFRNIFFEAKSLFHGVEISNDDIS
jgi:hypothetical protein